jgi:hypothetical protein
LGTIWARVDWTRAGTARTDWAQTRHGTKHGHGRDGHGRAGHGQIVSERHRYPLVIIKKLVVNVSHNGWWKCEHMT